MKNKMLNIFLLSILTIIGLVSPSAFSTELILNTESKYNPTYENRLSFMLGINPTVTKASELSNFSFSYAKKLESFWIDSNLLFTKGIFSEFSANNSLATGASDSQITQQQNSLVTVGVGIARETRYAQTLVSIDEIYEYMAANLTYNSYSEGYSGKTFTGPGLLAKFAVYKKFTEAFSAGAHFNYNLAVVERPEVNTESRSSRSLTLGFLTIGLDLSFFL
jgi:hypothetical protein